MCASLLCKILLLIAMILKVDTKETTDPVLKPEFPASDSMWQPVTGTRFRFYVYSAYIERRPTTPRPTVRVIAATRTLNPDSVFCRLWFQNNKAVTLRAKVRAIHENWGKEYSASFVFCILKKTNLKPDDLIGASVSIISKDLPNRRPTNHLKIRDTLITHKKDISDILHVCVQPLHFSYARNDWLLEWFELHKLLGATHFYMYNASMLESMGCLLNQYVKQGLVTLLPWHLPFISEVEIRTEGIFAAFNECLYRSMPHAGWLMNVDVDEVILPRNNMSMIELLSLLQNVKPNHSFRAARGVVLFRNVFFYLGWSNDETASVPLVTAQKTRRVIVPEPYRSRSKYVVRPNETIELGNHFPWLTLSKVSVEDVPTELAVLHHYRVACEEGASQCLSKPSMIDRTAHYWTKELAKRVSVARETMTAVCSKSGFV